MTAEVLPQTDEQAFHGEVLPQGDALKEIYALEFGSLDLPTTSRVTDDFTEANVVSLNTHVGIPELQKLYVAQATENAYADSWWRDVATVIRERTNEPEQADALRIVAKHTLEVLANDEPNGQNYEVYEFGEKEEDGRAVEVVLDTLQLIDQFSGGLMASDPDRPRIIIGNGARFEQNNGGGEINGVASEKFVYINMPGVRSIAKEYDADFHELLAVVVVHEVLGHALERRVEGYTGMRFEEFFDYSRNKVKGDIFDSIHETITPKAGGPTESKPVREYGRVNRAEDLATSVDATIADAMGWTETTDKIPRFRSELDTYRTDLALVLMHDAADMASQYDDTPGLVGSELRYVINEAGIITGVEPVRKMRLRSIGGAEAVRQEISKVVDKYKPGNEFIVSPGDFV